MDKQDLTATHFVTSRLVALAMALIGALFAFQTDWLGWTWLADNVGAERLLSVGVGCAFFLLAALSFEKNALRLKSAELFVALNQLLYGKNYAREREAIEILIRALGSGDAEQRGTAVEQLRRITGQNFADDPQVWRAWWEANKRHFARRRAAGGAEDELAADAEEERREDA